MVDFSRLRGGRQNVRPTDPIEVFRRLPRSGSINDLWTSQAEVLRLWYARREERDLVAKLNTGGGKTLVGLLMAQSSMNETKGTGLYLSPNRQLVEQTLRKAGEYGIPAVAYESGAGLHEQFLNGQAILIATYRALFNGKTVFGLAHTGRQVVGADVIVLDDAHVASSEIRDTFTLSVDAKTRHDSYLWITNLFRSDFETQQRIGTFNDIVSGRDEGVLEVPYWSWRTRINQVREHLAPDQNEEDFLFQWPLLRDNFTHCHALVSSREFVITPIFPIIDLFPTFADCRRRIYMSATLADDSALIRTFDADLDSMKTPLSTGSLAGVGERMILAPSLVTAQTQSSEAVTREAILSVLQQAGVVILVPSEAAAGKWKDAGTIVLRDQVGQAVESLTSGQTRGPYVLPNRYDGIDLPDDACRLLVLDGLPRGTTAYDLYRAAALEDSGVLASALAQRLEQGMGRASRGAGDYCVVLLLGRDLIAWVSKTANLELLTPSTRAQLEMGDEVSRNIRGSDVVIETIYQCLSRNRDWIQYHAEKLAEAGAGAPGVDDGPLNVAAKDRQAFKLIREGYYEKAIQTLIACAEAVPVADSTLRGWLYQQAARAADLWGAPDKAAELQRTARSVNKGLLRPLVDQPYFPLNAPGSQANSIVAEIAGFTFRRGFVDVFEQTVASLTPLATAKQFEEALKGLGKLLGYQAERPENDEGIGPDVLWLLSEGLGWVIEVKSRKEAANPLTKDEHGQLLNSYEWFKQAYPTYSGKKVVVHPNNTCTERVIPADASVLTLEGLGEIVSRARILFEDLTTSQLAHDALIARCQQRLTELELTPDRITATFLKPFQVIPTA